MKHLILILVLLLTPLPALAAQDFYLGTNRLEQLRSEIFTQVEQGETCQIVSVTGLIEVEGSYSLERQTNRDETDAFDLVLDEMRMGIDVQVTSWVGGTVSFSYREEVDDLELDEATINAEYGLLKGRFGRQFLPVGLHRTWLVSDPLTREIGETRATALSLGLESTYLSLTGFLLRSQYDDTLDVQNKLHDWGGALRFTLGDTLLVGAAYLNDLAETDAELLVQPYIEQVGGWSGWLRLSTPYLKLRGEVLRAERRFNPLDLDRNGDGLGDRPEVWLGELAIPLPMNLECALRYEGSRDLFGLPERQYGADLSWTILTGTTLSLEALRGEFDPLLTASGTLDRRDRLTLQMAVTF